MLPQFHTTIPIVFVPGYKIIMYNEYYIFLQTWKEIYAFSFNYGCIKFNFNVFFIESPILFSLSSIFQMLMTMMTIQFYSNCFIITHDFCTCLCSNASTTFVV
jgi:hypothetical protein